MAFSGAFTRPLRPALDPGAASAVAPSTIFDGLVEYLPLSDYSAGSGPVERVGLHLGTRWTDAANAPSTTGLVYPYAANFTQASLHYLSRTDYRLSLPGASFTVAAWVRRIENDATGYRGVFTNEGTGKGHSIFLTHDHTLVTNLNAVNYHNSDFGGAVMTRLEWHLVRCWYDASLGTWNNQLDMGAIGSWSVAAPVRGETNQIGRYGAGYWGGDIGPIIWWDRVLTSAEYAELYNGGAGVAYSGTGAEPAWMPTDIAGCSMWLDALDLDGTGNLNQGIADNATIASWVDKSDSGRTVGQSTDANRPNLRVAGAESAVGSKTYLHSLEFSANAYMFTNANLLSGTQGTVFAALKMFAKSAYQCVLGLGDEGGSYNHSLILSPYYDASNPGIGVRQVNADTVDQVHGNTLTDANVPYIMMWQSTGSAYALRINGADETETASSGANTGDWAGDVTGIDNITIGALKYNSLFFYLTAYVGEIIVFNTALSAPDIAAIEQYLAEKWGITLPS